MRPKRRRLTFVLIGLGLLGISAALILTSINDNLVYFRTPSELIKLKPAPDQRLRLGGLVEKGSLVKRDAEHVVVFRVTDMEETVSVTYTGLLPDLFREGQGVVADGHFQSDGTFKATEVLAKHDENYMPKEVADSLKKSGHWMEKDQKTQ